tara:strand:+ start:1015 stop:1425 length:411 start_codon:yes stop_codon:yes gene_type:complete
MKKILIVLIGLMVFAEAQPVLGGMPRGALLKVCQVLIDNNFDVKVLKKSKNPQRDGIYWASCISFFKGLISGVVFYNTALKRSGLGKICIPLNTKNKQPIITAINAVKNDTASDSPAEVVFTINKAWAKAWPCPRK